MFQETLDGKLLSKMWICFRGKPMNLTWPQSIKPVAVLKWQKGTNWIWVNAGWWPPWSCSLALICFSLQRRHNVHVKCVTHGPQTRRTTLFAATAERNSRIETLKRSGEKLDLTVCCFTLQHVLRSCMVPNLSEELKYFYNYLQIGNN